MVRIFYLILISLFSSQGFASCVCTYDFASKTASCTGNTCGDCFCQYECDATLGTCSGGTCPISGVISNPFVSSTLYLNCVGPALVTASQNNQLVNQTIDTSASSVNLTGMLGSTLGTYADAEKVYVLDETTLLTNEVHVTPSWCQ